MNVNGRGVLTATPSPSPSPSVVYLTDSRVGDFVDDVRDFVTALGGADVLAGFSFAVALTLGVVLGLALVGATR